MAIFFAFTVSNVQGKLGNIENYKTTNLGPDLKENDVVPKNKEGITSGSNSLTIQSQSNLTLDKETFMGQTHIKVSLSLKSIQVKSINN